MQRRVTPASRMRNASAAWGSALFLVVAPGTAAGLIPWLISRWQIRPPLLGVPLARVAGVFLIAAGIPVLLESFVRFARQGRGTPAPVLPPRHLVVAGFYRYVRNPMYLAVVWIVLGQGLFLGDVRLLVYAAVLWLIFHLFVLAYEEPTLRTTFGDEYEEFRTHVPRWLPRLRPWESGLY